MKIVSDGGTAELFKAIFADLDGEAADTVFVYIERRDGAGMRSTRSGFDGALAAVEENASSPIILAGWQTPKDYAHDPRWQKLGKLPNVVFLRLPVDHDDIVSAIQEARRRLGA
jgi:hypothetical protein